MEGKKITEEKKMRNVMKRFLAGTLAFMMLMGATGCAKAADDLAAGSGAQTEVLAESVLAAYNPLLSALFQKTKTSLYAYDSV